MKRIVIKVGSHVLAQNGGLAQDRIENLCAFLSKLQERYEVILVSSGAVAAGYTKLPLDRSQIGNKQAIASVGQPYLMSVYQKVFGKYGITVAQMLLGADDFDSLRRTKHAKEAVEVLLENRVIPIINENDVTTTQELVFGDNDQLSAHVAYFFDAQLLVILSDIDGYYDDDPRENPDAQMLQKVHHIDSDDLKVMHTPNGEFATGGIVTKLKAAAFLLERGREMFMASGYDLSDAQSFLLDHHHRGGTHFVGLEG